MGAKTVCSRVQNLFQVFNENGDVRLCGWATDDYIGDILNHSVEEIYNSERARAIIDRHVRHDYSLCDLDSCPYLADERMDEVLVPYEEQRFPKDIEIGFERVCNYACPSCTIHSTMVENNKKGSELEENYNKISKHLEEALPYVNTIGANGCGELFCSPRTLKLLADWHPVFPAEECSVGLETNGALFDEEHWRQIENLGTYHLKTCVTVMSFCEPIYQYLSGSKYPMQQIIDNLRFIKGLREKGIINELVLCTVVQEQNFREMPEFTRRCIEEFGADSVRLRPYEPWGAERRDVAWTKDIRVKDHPLYNEYKKVMQDPIFKHPKAKNGAGGLDAQWADRSPYCEELENEEMMTDIVLHSEEIAGHIKSMYGDRPLIIYGIENIGKVFAKKMIETGCNLKRIISYASFADDFYGVPVQKLTNADPAVGDEVVIITPMHALRKIKYELSIRNYQSVISIRELLKR